jgi:rod shape-determining protein MreC
MGVIDSNNHLIGITHTISNNFSTIISLLHIDLMISAKINNSGHYGTLSWDGRNPKVMQLYDIPKHANIKKGDTIITSGYSNILPEDIKIGKVLNYENEKNTNFLNICVDLFVDFTNIEFVYIIDSKFQSEREILEKNL